MCTFYAYPLNYGGNRTQFREVADNDFNTYTDSTNFLVHIDTMGEGSGNAKAFTDIFIKGTGIDSYTIALTDAVNITSPINRATLPATVTNDSEDEVATVIDGFQHDLLNVWTDESMQKPQAKTLTFTFTPISGQSVRVYEIAVLDKLLTLDIDGKFDKIEYDSIDLGTLKPDYNRGLTYIPALGNTRDKWLVNLSFLSTRSNIQGRDTLADTIVGFIRRYKNFVCIPEYERHPDRVLICVWPNPTTQIRYLTRWKGGGRRVNFSVREA